ncbi:MAG: putative beta-lysine N-acetyltransferase, partial [Planctomycetota bacterium]
MVDTPTPDFDAITHLGNTEIQHGKYNDRIYLMHLAREDYPEILPRLEEIAGKKRYSKIFAKVPAWARAAFLQAGYEVEAEVPGFFGGETDGLFLGRFLDEDRARPQRPQRIEEVLEAARAKAGTAEKNPGLAEGMELRECGPGDVESIVAVYREVFETYPFPIHDPAYIRETMDTHVRYFGVFRGEELIALSSTEMHREDGNVEMTDFATLPPARGSGAAQALLARMDEEMAR